MMTCARSLQGAKSRCLFIRHLWARWCRQKISMNPTKLQDGWSVIFSPWTSFIFPSILRIPIGCLLSVTSLCWFPVRRPSDPFSESDIPFFRNKIACDILRGSLTYHLNTLAVQNKKSRSLESWVIKKNNVYVYV